MTCQLALMNMRGVALASDSAATVGSKRTFNKREKIFTLGGGQPIGFLVAGNASYTPGDVEWERVIYLYSEYLGTKTHSTLSDYVSDFVNFVGQQDNLHDDRTNGLSIQKGLLNYFGDLVNRAGNEDTAIWVENVLDTQSELRDSVDLLDLIRKLHGEHTKAAAQLFCRFQDLPKKFEKKMEKIFNFHLAHGDEPQQFVDDARPMKLPTLSSRIRSGGFTFSKLVIAGFGSEQVTPELRELTVGAIIDPKDGAFDYGDFHTIRGPVDLSDKGKWRAEAEDSTYSGISWILRYAQSEEIDNILNGIHETDYAHLTSQMPEVIYQQVTEFIQDELKNVEGIGTKTLEKIEKRFNEIQTSSIKLLHDAVRTALDFGSEKRWLNFSHSVAVMSMQELAAFSKHLVSMEALITYHIEEVRSVSEPVNVATITKENGFSWVQ